MKPNTNPKLLFVQIKGPKNELFNGQAFSVTSVNKSGKFDILPFHTNFITLIREYVIIKEENKKEITFPLESGILKVNEDNVKVLIGV